MNVKKFESVIEECGNAKRRMMINLGQREQRKHRMVARGVSVQDWQVDGSLRACKVHHLRTLTVYQIGYARLWAV